MGVGWPQNLLEWSNRLGNGWTANLWCNLRSGRLVVMGENRMAAVEFGWVEWVVYHRDASSWRAKHNMGLSFWLRSLASATS